MDRVNLLANERVGLPDAIDGIGGLLVQADQIRESRLFAMPSGRTTGAANTSARVLGGFDWQTIAFASDTSATLNRGSGFFPYLDASGAIQFGLVFGDEGAASITFDFTTVAASTTHAVYARAVFTPAEQENRVFWNPTLSTEFVDTISSRLVSGWEIVVQAQLAPPPGSGDFVKIWEVVLDGSNQITSVTDFRHTYFEGDANGAAFTQEWGDGANDRNADRVLYGVKDLHQWSQALRRQLTDIVGTNWWEAPETSLKAAAGKLARFVTVDQPGGPGGDGEYATIAAAVTALNAANGGTILLRSGTYAITASLAVTTAIKFVGVERGVSFSNQINVDNVFVFSFSTFSAAGSEIWGVNITSTSALSSEHAVSVGPNVAGLGVKMRNCDVVGEIDVNGGVLTMESCVHNEDPQSARSPRMMSITGAGPRVSLRDHQVFLGSTPRTLCYLVHAVSVNGTTGIKGSVTLDNVLFFNSAADCQVFKSNVSQFVNIRWRGVAVHMTAGLQVLDAAVKFAGGDVELDQVLLKFEQSGVGTDPFLVVSGTNVATDKFSAKGLTLDGSSLQYTINSEARAMCVFAGRAVEVSDLTVRDWTFGENGIRQFPLVLLDPPTTTSSIRVSQSKFIGILNDNTVDNDWFVLGRWAEGALVDGLVSVTHCVFDQTINVTKFSGTAEFGTFRYYTAESVEFCHNTIIGGAQYIPVYCENVNGDFSFNRFIQPSSLAAGSRWAVALFFLSGTGSGGNQTLTVSHNVMRLRADATTGSLPMIQAVTGWNKIVCIGNTVNGSNTGASEDIDLTANKVTAYGNNTDNGILVSAATQKPAVLTDHNI